MDGKVRRKDGYGYAHNPCMSDVITGASDLACLLTAIYRVVTAARNILPSLTLSNCRHRSIASTASGVGRWAGNHCRCLPVDGTGLLLPNGRQMTV